MRFNGAKLQGDEDSLRKVQVIYCGHPFLPLPSSRSLSVFSLILALVWNDVRSSKGLEILAFPCNNFGSQEPGSNADILRFATKKGATFPILGKLECENGDKTHVVYQFLKASVPAGMFGRALKWNFTKFICDANGVPQRRYSPTTSPLSLEKDILAYLKN